MADSLPSMNWGSTNLTEAFSLFKQKCELYFTIKKITGEQQVPYILRAVEDEGLKRYNSWTLTETEKKDPSHLWACFTSQLEPSQNFHVARLKLHYYYQKSNETLDDFITRCRGQVAKCNFTPEETNERILEQIIASTPITDFQKELPEKPKDYTLGQAIELGRTFEATRQSLTELKNMNTTDTTTSAVHGIRRSCCKNCGGSHPRGPEKSVLPITQHVMPVGRRDTGKNTVSLQGISSNRHTSIKTNILQTVNQEIGNQNNNPRQEDSITGTVNRERILGATRL